MKLAPRVATVAVVLSLAGLVLGCNGGASSGRGAGSPSSLAKAGPAEGEDNAAPRVDIVFALDTTSSMSGLIDGAKQKIWEIARKAQEGKPSPEGYLKAAALLGVRSAGCLVVEDAPAGVRAGKAAGMTVLAIASTHRVDELSDADEVVLSLAKAGSHVRGWLNG